MRKKHKLLRGSDVLVRRLFIGFALFLVSFSALSTLLATRVHAAGIQTPYDEIKAYQAVKFLDFCGRQGWQRDRNVSEFQNGLIYVNSQWDKPVGYVLDSGDGSIECRDSADVKLAFDAIKNVTGKSTLQLLLDAGIYKKNGGDATLYSPADDNGDPYNLQKKLTKYLNDNYFKGALDQNMTEPAQYWNLEAAFSKECKGKKLDKDSGGTQVWLVNNATGEITKPYYEIKEVSQVNVGFGMDGDGGGDMIMTCGTIIKQMEKMAPFASDNVKALVAANIDTSDLGKANDSDLKPQTCEAANALILSWIVCPFISLIDNSVEKMGKMIDNMLSIGSDVYERNELYAVWSYFRILATLLLVAIGLVMVISQAISIGPFDAYTVKKVFPRLVVGVIGIQLSWYLFSALIQITNSIAWGIQDLMYAPFGGSAHFDFGAIINSANFGAGGFFAAAAVGAVAGGLALGLFGILSFALTALLGVLIAFILLGFRRMVLVALLLVSPIAIVCWILPNTEKVWKLWWESFSKLLLMYPMIIFLISAGRIFAWTAGNLDTSAPVTEGAIASLTSFLAVVFGYFGPFFLIPKTFQLAGSAFANIAGIANNRSKGVFDRLKNYRGNKMSENWQNTKTGNRFAGGNTTNIRGRLNRGLQYGSNVNKAGMDPRMWGSKMAATVSTSALNEAAENLDKNPDYVSWKGNDTLNKYAAASTSAADLRKRLQADQAKVYSQYMENGELSDAGKAQMETDIARVESVRRAMSAPAFKQMTTLQAIAGGTAYDTAGDMAQAIADAAGSDDAAVASLVAKGRSAAMSAGRIDQGGAGFGATFKAVQGVRDGQSGGKTFTAEDANRAIHQGAVANQGPGALLHSSMKTSSIEQLAPEIRGNLENAARAAFRGEQVQADGTVKVLNASERQAAQVSFKRELAKVAGTYDAMAQTSPAQAEVFASQVMGAGMIADQQGGMQTIQSLVDGSRNDSDFLSMRREYSSAAASAEDRARNAAQTGQPGGPPSAGDIGFHGGL